MRHTDGQVHVRRRTRGMGVDRRDQSVGHGGCGIEPDPPPGVVRWSLVREDRRKANARIVQHYVIPMNDAAHAESDALIVIRADGNLESRDRTPPIGI